MLSKGQAKTFFLVGTFLCGTVFVGLTIDTFKQLPKRTNENEMTAEVIRGKHLFDKNNCMGCHTILGEGAYYAPELTKVYERRGESFIKDMLTDPQKMFPGERKMVKYDFSEQDKNDLVQFFKWIGKIDTNGFPAKPDLKSTEAVASGLNVDMSKAPQKFTQVCLTCHMIGGNGGEVGPALDGIASRRDATYLKNWLKDPSQIKADAKMPKLELTDQEIDEMVSFLTELK